MSGIAPYWKAIVGFLAPGATLLVFAITEASAGNEDITQAEWIGAALACVVTGAGVYRIGNKDPKATHQDESVQPPGA